MSQTGTDTDEMAARLEAALERIAAAARRPQATSAAPGADLPTAEIASRLDSLIVQIRTALDSLDD